MVTGNQQASRSRQNFRSGSSSIGRQKGSSATNNGYRTSRGLESGASRSGGGHRLLEGLPNDIRRRIPKKRLTLAIDYGTTFSSVSYNVRGFDEYEDSFHSRVTVNVRTVKNWPDEPSGLAEQVPTESWYPSIPLRRKSPFFQFDSPGFSETSEILFPNKSTVSGYAPSDHLNQSDLAGTDSEGEDSNNNEGSKSDFDTSKEFLWGYSVSIRKLQYRHNRDTSLIVKRPKLLLLSTTYTENSRTELRSQINKLLEQNIIRKYGKESEPDMRDVQDIIIDYLTGLLQHTKDQLIIYEGYTDAWAVDFAIAAPAIWSPEASRILQAAMEAAIFATGFGSLTDGKKSGQINGGGIDNLFIGPEPECGITWLIHDPPPAHEQVVAGNAVTSLDCGGGTVDAVTYQIGSNYPLRLGEQIVPPGGDNCGASYLNKRFEQFATRRLRDEKYLLETGYTLEYIVDKASAQFELNDKRNKDVTQSPLSMGFYEIPNLKSDISRGLYGKMAKDFDDNHMVLHEKHYKEIFDKLLLRVWKVLKAQLDAAALKNRPVKVVFLFGGFASAPSLRSFIQSSLKNYEQEEGLNYPIKLIEDSRKTVAAISAGSVLRSLNHIEGPERVAKSSYGLFRREPHSQREHGRVLPVVDEVDGGKYVPVINYFVTKGQRLDKVHEFEPIRCYHTFLCENEDRAMLCEELLYVSDTVTVSHKTLNSPKNKGVQLEGKIITDMTFLKDENLIVPIIPEPDANGTVNGKPHYRIEYDLVPIIEKRNLRIEARWPVQPLSDPDADAGHSGGSPSKRRKVEQRAIKTTLVSIAAAFEPGTS
ncbi:hypothetical protein IFR04_006131 [Cadophora malorum]|uniref:Actin-like ATPase domain-containing protein n=1 Tax=Cadophora malorum TaxID=108018 RepID=A0A8H7W860_9HELO|nr:hypothetical protein IFR04_006131 [Cadophora malorum]